MSVKQCFVCNIAAVNYERNLAQIKSEHSRYPLSIFIKKFLRKSILNRNVNNPENCICNNCLVRVNEYDQICVQAKRIEDELHRKLIKSDESWQNSTEFEQDDNGLENTQDGPDAMEEGSSSNRNEQEDNSYPTPENVFKCMICKQIFRHFSYYQRHVELHEKEELEPFRCDICYEKFKDEQDFETHKSLHTDIPPLQCIYCKKDFIHKRYLVRHVQTQHVEENFQCDICGKLCSNMRLLKAHLPSHVDDRPEKCDICSRQFKNKIILKKHMHTHTGEKLFSCSICGKAFNNRYNRNVHEKLHEGTHADNKHKCTFCTSAFASKAKLKEHMEKNHGIMMPHVSVETKLE